MLRPRLDVRHLAMVDAIARTGTISGAGRMLGLTQPAISRQLQEAERRLGANLIQRDGRSVSLTVAGETILHCARRVLVDLAISERSVAIIPDEPPLTVRLSLGAYDDYRWFPGFFRAMAAEDEDINLNVADAGECDLLDALEDHAIDLAVMPGPADSRRFTVVPLFEDELMAISAPDHPFAEKDHLDATDFADQVYATWGVTYHQGFESDRVLLPAGVWPARVVTIGMASAILDFVQSGQAITVLSSWFASKPTEHSLAQRKITEAGLKVEWNAVVRRSDGPKSPAHSVAKFLKYWCGSDSSRFAQTERRSSAPDRVLR